jgi:hypothetical protein
VSASKHVEAFTNWAFAIKLGQLGKVRYLIDPNNKELREFAARRHETCILPPIGGGTSNGTSIATHPGDTTEVFRTLSEGLKRMGEAADQTLILKKEEMRLKGEADNLKKDRIKDMHASISNMILMASATKLDRIRTFNDSFKAFYNSKNQGYADLELHHQFDAKDLQNLGFAEGTVLALWSGLLKRSNPTAPSNCTPFAFRELQPMNMNQKSWSLICTMINQRGGLAQSTEEIKAKAKQEVSAPKNYNKMLFQLKAFIALIEILFGDESIMALKLQAFIQQIKTHNVFYKGYAALDDFFPTKVLWTVCTRFQLYLKNCTQANQLPPH